MKNPAAMPLCAASSERQKHRRGYRAPPPRPAPPRRARLVPEPRSRANLDSGGSRVETRLADSLLRWVTRVLERWTRHIILSHSRAVLSPVGFMWLDFDSSVSRYPRSAFDFEPYIPVVRAGAAADCKRPPIDLRSDQCGSLWIGEWPSG